MLRVVALSSARSALQSTPAQLYWAMNNTKAHINIISNPLTIKILNVMHHHHVMPSFSSSFPPHYTFPLFVFNTSMDDSILADAVRRPSIRRYFCNPVLNTSPLCVCVCAHRTRDGESSHVLPRGVGGGGGCLPALTQHSSSVKERRNSLSSWATVTLHEQALVSAAIHALSPRRHDTWTWVY